MDRRWDRRRAAPWWATDLKCQRIRRRLRLRHSLQRRRHHLEEAMEVCQSVRLNRPRLVEALMLLMVLQNTVHHSLVLLPLQQAVQNLPIREQATAQLKLM